MNAHLLLQAGQLDVLVYVTPPPRGEQQLLFVAHRITKEEASYKLLKVKRSQVGKGGVPYIATHDGRTIRYPDPDIKVCGVVCAVCVCAVLCVYVLCCPVCCVSVLCILCASFDGCQRRQRATRRCAAPLEMPAPTLEMPGSHTHAPSTPRPAPLRPGQRLGHV